MRRPAQLLAQRLNWMQQMLSLSWPVPLLQEFNVASLSKGKFQDNNEFMQVGGRPMRAGW